MTDFGPLGLADRNVPSGFPAASRGRERWAIREDGVSRKEAVSVEQQGTGKVDNIDFEEKSMQLPEHSFIFLCHLRPCNGEEYRVNSVKVTRASWQASRGPVRGSGTTQVFRVQEMKS